MCCLPKLPPSTSFDLGIRIIIVEIKRENPVFENKRLSCFRVKVSWETYSWEVIGIHALGLDICFHGTTPSVVIPPAPPVAILVLLGSLREDINEKKSFL